MTQPSQQESHIKRTHKDSVFTDLFSIPEYQLMLYQELHPEDREATEGDLETVTLQNVIVTGQYNDLGFTVGDRLLILVEAQSTWSANVVLRALFYLSDTLRRWVRDRKLDLYSSKVVHVPTPEVYVLYTGEQKSAPKELSLERDVFELGKGDDGEGAMLGGIEVRARVLRGEGDGITAQYVSYTRVGDECVRKYGYTREAAEATVDECIERGILVNYMKKRRREVEDMVYQLFNEDEVRRVHELNLQREAEERGLRIGEERGLRIGEERGLRIGEERGLRIGEERGMRAGSESKGLEIAARLLGRGMAVAEVADLTGLEPAAVAALAQN